MDICLNFCLLQGTFRCQQIRVGGSAAGSRHLDRGCRTTAPWGSRGRRGRFRSPSKWPSSWAHVDAPLALGPAQSCSGACTSGDAGDRELLLAHSRMKKIKQNLFLMQILEKQLQRIIIVSCIKTILSSTWARIYSTFFFSKYS